MAAFLTPTDIGNRALQHVGQEMMDPLLGFTEPSVRAAAIRFVYDKLRRAELRRNIWVFAIRTAALRPIKTNTTDNTDTMLLVPALWAQTTTYFQGSIGVDQNGTLWQSAVPNNLANDPLTSRTWQEYFGPMSVAAWDTTGTTAYYAGELVYTSTGAGISRTFLSMINGNTDNPATATTWIATATYYKNDVITLLGVSYMSLIDLNLNQNPSLAPALWSASTTYAAAAKVGGSDGVIYQSIGSGNINHDPTTSPGFWTNTGVLNPWTTVFVGGTGSVNWLQIGGPEFPMGVTITPFNMIYPIGSGSTTQASTRNVFRKPAGFLRKAPQDPKAGSQSWVGAPSGITYDDWVFQDQYITSRKSDVILLRFVADTVDVTTFDDMFCEGLGARCGLEVCEPLTQKTEKKAMIAQAYAKFIGEARTVDAIEEGPVEPPVDDYITARL